MSSSNSTDNGQKQVQYFYIPTEWVCILFVVLFGLTTIIHTVQAVRSRYWWLFPTAILCGLLELAGWGSRLWSNKNPYIDLPVIIHSITLIVAPTPLVAANFLVLGRIIRRLGPQYSRLTPRRYSIIFVSCDIISLIVQALGGVLASGSQTPQSQANLGAAIALGGTIFQLMAIIAYCSLAYEFISRYTKDRPVRRLASDEVFRGKMDERLNRMLQAMLTMTVFIMIRTIYRVVEFAGGLNGTVLKTQWPFNLFDALMITLAMLTLNRFHPSIYLRDDLPSGTREAQTLGGSKGTALEKPNQNPV